MNLCSNHGLHVFNKTAPEQMTWEQFFVLYEYQEWIRLTGERVEGRDVLVFDNPGGE